MFNLLPQYFFPVGFRPPLRKIRAQSLIEVIQHRDCYKYVLHNVPWAVLLSTFCGKLIQTRRTIIQLIR